MSEDRAHNLSLEEMDQQSFFHPFTSIADHLTKGPRIMARGSGAYVTDMAGRRYLDGAAGLWCVNVGYGRKEIVEAITRQAEALPFFHAFTSMSNEPSIRLAHKVLQHLPDNMSKIFFGNSGSDANDTNIKIVWYYNNLRGRPQKKKIISRQRSYHGSTVAAGSLTGIPIVHDAFDLPIANILHTLSVDTYREKPTGMTDTQYSQYLADELEKMILSEGPDTVAAFIAEPVMASGGILVPPKGYFSAIKAVLRKYDVLMIADEVVCGFGRLGHWFGSDCYQIEPDIMTLAKGLSSGYQPISGSAISKEIWEILESTAATRASFGHGYTYSAHPIAAAAALANVQIIEREDLVVRAKASGDVLMSRLRSELQDHPLVGDIRGVGLVIGVELVADKITKAQFDPALKVAGQVMRRGYEENVIVRALPYGSTIGMSPPLIIGPSEVDELVTGLRRAIDFVKDELVRSGSSSIKH